MRPLAAWLRGKVDKFSRAKDRLFDIVGILPRHRSFMTCLLGLILFAIVFRVILKGPSLLPFLSRIFDLTTLQYHSSSTHVYFSLAPILFPLLVAGVGHIWNLLR
eukprot:RCo049310